MIHLSNGDTIVVSQAIDGMERIVEYFDVLGKEDAKTREELREFMEDADTEDVELFTKK